MIASFGDKTTLKIWEGEWVKNLPPEVQEIGRRKLRMINNSQNINDLMVPPANRLERLKGNLKKFYSIRIIELQTVLEGLGPSPAWAGLLWRIQLQPTKAVRRSS